MHDIVAGCWCIWSWVDVVARVVLRRVSVPAVIEYALVMSFVIVEREVPVFEPDDFEAGSRNGVRIEIGTVATHQPIRCKIRLFLDSPESVVGS